VAEVTKKWAGLSLPSLSLPRAVARILVQGGLNIWGWGQVRPKKPKAGMGFLGRGQPASSPSARGSWGAL